MDPPGQAGVAQSAWDPAIVPGSTTVSLNLTTVAGSNLATITGCNAVLISNQAAVSGPNVPAGTNIVGGTCGTNTIQLSANATATGTAIHTFTLPPYGQNYPPTNQGIPMGTTCSICPATFSAPICAGEYVNYYMCVGNSYSISLCSSLTEWNSTISVTNTAGSSLAPGIGNYDDDGCGTPGGHAQVTFSPTTSGTYRIRVFEDPCMVNAAACGTLTVTCSVSEPPSNDDAANATPLSVAPTCASVEASTDFATLSSGAALPANCGANCAPGSAAFAGYDVWFSLTVPSSGEVVLQTELLTAGDLAMAAYSGTPGNLVQLNGPGFCGSCNADAAVGVPDPFLWLTGLNPGSTIYVRIWPQGGPGNSGSFSICAMEPAPPQNDEPCGALSLMAAADCETTFINLMFATAGATGMTITPADPSCGGSAPSDVWVEVAMPGSGGMLITTAAGSVSDAAVAVYGLTSGSACAGTLTELACATGGSGMPVLEFGGTPGTTYYLRLWSETAVFGGFSICVEEIAPPGNDEPGNAQPLAFSTDCQVVRSAWLATASSVDDPVNCEADCSAGSGGYAGGDVWYSLDMAQYTSVLLQAHGLNGTVGMAVYGGTADALTQLNLPGICSSCAYEAGDAITLHLPGLGSGSTIWVRIWPADGTPDLDFILCASPTELSPISDCFGSMEVCGNDTISLAPNGFGASNDLNVDNRGCLNGEQQGVWMNVTTIADGQLAFTINPSPNTDYDFGVWGPYTDNIPCPPDSDPIRCSWAGLPGPTGLNYSSGDISEGAAGDGFVRRITVTAHQTYLIYVDNFSQNGLAFDLVWDNQPSNLIDCISTSVMEASSAATVTLVPNPAHDALRTTWPFTGAGRIEVLDAKGSRALQLGHDGAPGLTLDVSALPEGLYTLRMLGEGRAVSARFVKE